MEIQILQEGAYRLKPFHTEFANESTSVPFVYVNAYEVIPLLTRLEFDHVTKRLGWQHVQYTVNFVISSSRVFFGRHDRLGNGYSMKETRKNGYFGIDRTTALGFLSSSSQANGLSVFHCRNQQS